MDFFYVIECKHLATSPGCGYQLNPFLAFYLKSCPTSYELVLISLIFMIDLFLWHVILQSDSFFKVWLLQIEVNTSGSMNILT